MLSRLTESILGRIIGIVIHKNERLTDKEAAAQKAVFARLTVSTGKTTKPAIVAMIGLTGSGKSSVAKELAKHLAATVIEGDDIRIELRKRSERYERTRAIAENLAIELVQGGKNVVIDSDFIDSKKRASLREKARRAKIKLVFLCTYCDLDITIGRIITTPTEKFFQGAGTKWQCDTGSKGTVVKLREMWRRIPQHYRWSKKGGGQWIIKNPLCAVVADIDTAEPDSWKQAVAKCAKELIQ